MLLILPRDSMQLDASCFDISSPIWMDKRKLRCVWFDFHIMNRKVVVPLIYTKCVYTCKPIGKVE